MKPLSEVCLTEMNRKRHHASISARLILSMLLVSVVVLGTYGQTVSWSDSFVQNRDATTEQCQNWAAFLDELGNKKFVSVKFSGSQDLVGKTITDPAAATELARLLNERIPGVVTVGDDNWVVTTCGASSCGAPSVALSWNGNVDGCLCSDQYAIKPHTGGTQWGGLNSESCNAVSQDFTIEFHSGVSITANGPTTFCKGQVVTLAASANICEGGPYTYKWSTLETTPTIQVSKTGDYYVTVYGPDLNCNAMSETVHVTVTDISLTVTEAFTVCDVPVTLTAEGSSTGGTDPIVNKYCLFDVGDSNCTFTTRICSDGYRQMGNESFTQILPSAKPSEIRISLYYNQTWGQSEFTFRINGQVSTFLEVLAPNSCFPGVQYPRTFTFKEQELTDWNSSGNNTVTVEVFADNGAVYFAGIVVETVLPGETYSWSPTDGLLSSPLMANPLAKPSVTTTYTVTYADASGCRTSADVLVTVKCSAVPCKDLTVPVAANCLATVDPRLLYGGTISEGMTFVAEPPGPYGIGLHTIKVIATDNGVTTSCTANVTVIDDIKPTITLKDVTVPNDRGACYATLNLLDPLLQPVLSDNCGVSLDKLTKDKTDDIFSGITTVTWTVTDVNGNQQIATQKVTVTNATPVISSVVPSETSVAVNQPVILTITYADDNVANAVINWGDDSTPETINDPLNIFEASHAYLTSGSYSATITLTDACGSSAYVYQSITVFNQRGASAKGAGWFESPPGSYMKDLHASGKATFSVEAVNQTIDQAPVGKTSFNFKAGKLKFKSTAYQWLNVEGKTATLKGSGTVNNIRGYQILISMLTENTPNVSSTGKNKQPKTKDKIRVKIWDPSGVAIYDTQPGSPDEAIPSTPLGAGQLTIEEAASALSETYESPVASSFGEESMSAYPNPFIDWMEVEFPSASQENVIIQLLDMAGNAILNRVFPASEDGSYLFEIPQSANGGPGTYFLTIRQGKKVKILRVARD
jgi:hypothetical protein